MTDPRIMHCDWKQDEHYGGWDTACGHGFELHDGTPAKNGMTYCPFCGVIIREAETVEHEDTL